MEKMTNLTIIIPILNEEKVLPSLLEKIATYSLSINLIFCDGGSSDGGLDILKNFKNKSNRSNIEILSENLEAPSIIKTLNLARDAIKTDYVLLHPVDADCTSVLIGFNVLIQKRSEVIIFFKKYSPSTALLHLQELVLNNIRVRIFKKFVWTNCPALRSDIFLEILKHDHGFLEDVITSEYLRSLYTPQICTKSVVISSRRYQKDGTLKRVLSNLLILFLYQFNLKTIAELKVMYHKEK